MKEKAWYESKTIWIAIIQVVAGAAASLLSEDPTIRTAGVIAVVKGVLDVVMRVQTDKAVTL